MAKKFTYSRTLSSFEGIETFEAVEFDSFDEARKVVDKAIHERKIELKSSAPQGLGALQAGVAPSSPKSGDNVLSNPSNKGDNKGNAPANVQGPAPRA